MCPSAACDTRVPPNNIHKCKFRTRVKKAAYLKDNSFTFGYTLDKLSNKDIYIYYSENELPSHARKHCNKPAQTHSDRENITHVIFINYF